MAITTKQDNDTGKILKFPSKRIPVVLSKRPQQQDPSTESIKKISILLNQLKELHNER